MRNRQATPLRPLLIGLLCGLLLLPLGCGRKASPRAPKAQPLPVARNLRAVVEADTVVLAWELAPLGARMAKDARFALYRDALPLGAGACLNCAPRYELIALVAYDPEAAMGGAGQAFTYSETLARGFRYRYQVALRLDNGRQGDPSEPVEVMLD